MKKIKILTMLVLVLFASNLVKAQVTGLGTATSATPPALIDHIYNTDDTRFPVNNISPGV